MNYNLSHLLPFFTTKQELVNFTSQLDVLQQALYTVNVNMLQKINELIPMNKKDALLACLRENNIDPASRDGLQKFIADFKAQAKNIPVLTLYVAFDPTEDTMKSISLWIHNTLQRHILIEVIIRQTLLGGAIVTYSGIYKDYSLRKRFKENFLTRDLFAEFGGAERQKKARGVALATPVPKTQQVSTSLPVAQQEQTQKPEQTTPQTAPEIAPEVIAQAAQVGAQPVAQNDTPSPFHISQPIPTNQTPIVAASN